MEQLPDDALLLVLQHVDVADLFTCRRVSKRLASLSMDPCVWRHKRMDQSRDSIRWTCPVLRLAPRLKSLSVDLSKKQCYLPFATSKCAVEELSISVAGNDGGSAKHIIYLIRNQAALGRLKNLSVNYSPSQANHEDKCVMFSTIMTISGLEKLSVRCATFTGFSEAAHHCILPEPSLKEFRCNLLPRMKSESFCNIILAAHAATLEVVSLRHFIGFTSVPLFASKLTSIISLLAGMPNLRELHCYMLPGLETVAACKSLRELNLLVTPEEPPSTRSAKEFLCRAKQLRSLSLDYQCNEDIPTDVDLVLALVSGPAQLQSLIIDNTRGPYSFPQAQSLVTALLSLVALQDLRLCALEGLPSDELLRAIRPDSNPALKCLTFENRIGLGEVACVHAWLHSNAVRTALLTNPLLHVKVNPWDKDEHFGIFCSVDRCEKYCRRQTCRRRCYKKLEMLSDERSYLCLFSHSPEVTCGVDHTDGCVWMQIQ